MTLNQRACRGQFAGIHGPRQLWSLWDMFEIAAREFYYASSLYGMIYTFTKNRDEDEVVASDIAADFSRDLVSLAPHLAKLGAPVTCKAIGRLVVRLGKEKLVCADVANAVSEINNMLQDELDSGAFLVLGKDGEKYFAPSEPLFGRDVDAKFPSVQYEITEAAKCLALDRSTASAFHSIRTLEAAIRALSRCLGIPDPTRASDRSWFKLLGALKTEIERRWRTTTARMSGDGEFFENAHAALAAMQNPWRNATMHLDQKYTPEEAEDVFGSVRGFIKRIASRMDEDGEPKA